MKQSNGFNPVWYALQVAVEKMRLKQSGESTYYTYGELGSMFHTIMLCTHNTEEDETIREIAKVLRDTMAELEYESKLKGV